MRKLLAVLTVLGFTAGMAHAELLVGWNSQGLSGVTEDPWESTSEADNMDVGQVTRGAGVTASSLANGFAANTWNVTESVAHDEDHYFQISVSAAAGYWMEITDFNVHVRWTGTGPEGLSLRSSLDNFAADLWREDDFNSGSTGDGLFAHEFVTPLQNITSIDFRLYGFDASGAAGTLAFREAGAGNNEIEMFGEVTLIPEPGTSMLTLIGLGVILGIRRRMATK